MIIFVQSRDLMILHDWQVVKVILEPVFGNTLKYWIETLPGFNEENFPFVICSGWESFNLINVNEMTMQEFVNPFGKFNMRMAQEAAIFIKEKSGFSMHF